MTKIARKENWTYRDTSIFIRLIRKELNLKPKLGRKLNQLPTVEDWGKYFQYLAQNYDLLTWTFFNLLYVTGMRISEAVNLKKDQIDYSAKKIFIRSGKYNKDRIVFFTDEIGLLLRQIAQNSPNDWVFVNSKTGLPFTARRWEKITQDIRRACNISIKITPHTNRHYFATKIVNEQGLEAAKNLLGHASIATTSDMYTHIATDELQKKYEKIKWREI